MNKTKIGSLALSAVFLGTTVLGFAGCKKGAGKAKEVPKDAPWYDVKVTTFDTPQGASEEGYSYYGDYVICKNDIVTSYYTYDEATNMSYIIDYDMDGNIKSQIYIRDLFEDPKDTQTKTNPVDESMKEIEGTTEEEDVTEPDCFVTNDGDTRYYDVRNIFKDGDGFGAFLSYYDYSGMDYSEHYFIYSSKDGSVKELEALSNITGNNSWFSGIFGMGDGELGVVLEEWNDKTYESEYTLVIIKDDSVKSQTKLSDVMKDDKVNYVESAEYTDGQIVLSCYTDNGGMARYSINPDTKEATKEDLGGSSYYNSNVADNGVEYYVNETGVFEAKEVKEGEEKVPVISFDDCNILRSDVWGMKVITMSDTGCTMFGSMYDSGSDHSYFKMYEFTKAESNPNAGEKIISIGYTDYLSTGVYKAIYDFNEKSDEYFITVTDVYANTDDLEELWNGGGDEDDEDRYRKAYNEHNSKLMDKLSVDLLAGDAPDIIFGTNPYIQLKDEKFLIDLMPKIEKDLGIDSFFPNVINSAKTGDNLYSMPLSFEVTGIMADIKAAGDKDGFTFKEYSKFVNDVCNGKDPVGTYMTRMEYFQQVFETMADLYYDKDGNINLQTEAFYELAEYCKDNVPESFDEEEYYDDYDYGCYGENTKADTAYLYNINSYLDLSYDSKGSKIKELYGYPSYDGRGAVVQVDVSVSISALSAVQDGAWGFVKSLLEESNQKDMAIENYTNPVNIEACKAVALKSVKDNNADAEKYIKQDPQAAQWYRVYKEEVVDDYIDALQSATSSSTIDPAIITIVDEEIQAYFAGQKSIEEVTETIQNRAQTLINERKA